MDWVQPLECVLLGLIPQRFNPVSWPPVLSQYSLRDWEAEETGDSECEWEPDPAASSDRGTAQSPTDPQSGWEPDLRVPLWTRDTEAVGPAGPFQKPDPQCSCRGV